MATIASLIVNLGLNSAAFSKGTGKARGDLAMLDKAASSIRNTFLKVGGVLAGAFAVNKIQDSITDTMESIDETAKAADRLGLSTEAFVGIQHGANLAGVAAESLNTAMTRLLNNVSEAASLGTGEAVKSLKQIGLSAKQLEGLSADQQLALIADGMNGLETEADKVRVAMDLFGRSGAGMVNFLAEGSAGLKAAEQDAAALGIAFNRLDAHKVEQANDAITRAKSALKGLATTAGITLAPMLTAAADRFSAFVASGEGAKVVEKIMRGIAVGIGAIVHIGAQAVQFFRDYGKGILITVGAIKALVIAYKAYTLATQAAAKAQTALLALSGPKGWAILAAGAVVAGGAIVALNAAFDGVAESANASLAAADKAVAATSDVGKTAAKSAANAAEGFADAAKVLSDFALQTSDLLLSAEELERKRFAVQIEQAGGGNALLKQGMNLFDDRAHALAVKKTAEEMQQAQADLQKELKSEQALLSGIAAEQHEVNELRMQAAELAKQAVAFQQQMNATGNLEEIGRLQQKIIDIKAQENNTKRLADLQTEINKTRELAKAREDAAKRQADAIEELQQAAVDAFQQPRDDAKGFVEGLLNSAKTKQQRLEEGLAKIQMAQQLTQQKIVDGMLVDVPLLTAEQAAMAQEQLRKDVFGGGERAAPDRTAGAALEAGTQGAYSAIVKAMGMGDREKVPKDQLNEAKKANQHLKKIAAAPRVNLQVVNADQGV